ncbi:MAG: CpaF family protein [Candidatus Diapherotrites archaeon]|nr:CpaF family protein [Candidatus Diapherotrites archaeon]
MADELLKKYELPGTLIKAKVNVLRKSTEFVLIYNLDLPEIGPGTKAMVDSLKRLLVSDTSIKTEKMLDQKFISELREKFIQKSRDFMDKEAGKISEDEKNYVIEMLVNEMLGLGPMELLLLDGNLEEIVVNSAKEPVWVYHKEFGWLKTNITFRDESEIQNYGNIIARRVGKQITILQPLLDAHLITGDRANATIFPISSAGNTITIRRFRREPWTVTDFTENNTTTSDVMALIWLCMQYELNMILSGGTASGKTSFLNVCLPFIPPNHRVITIEDTRELLLPSFLHWVPMTTREPNPEGKGGIEMINLLVNSLRMRPDRIIVGEVRRQKEAEVMFEAMHTGHSVYTTVHANTADETIKRLSNAPIEIPTTMLEGVHLNVVMFRNRRLGVRRVLELAEFIPEKRGGAQKEGLTANVLYKWHPASDKIEKNAESIRLFDELGLHTGLGLTEIQQDLDEKKIILEWMVKKDIRHIQKVGKVMATYYMDRDTVIEAAKKGALPEWLR